MSSPHHIQATTVAVSIPRQTPKDEFGTLLAASLGEAVDRGAGLLGVASRMTPAASAAVSGLGQVSRTVSGGTALPATVVSFSGGATGVPGAGVDPILNLGTDASGYGPLLQQISGKDPSEAAYLELQMKMNRESQQFSTVSNIMKVRSDSAKAAINNIR